MKPLLFLLIVLGGCASLNESQNFQAQFNESEFEPYKRSGTAIINGQAFSKTRGGDVKLGAGAEVFLVPRTSYSREFLRVRIEEAKKVFPQEIRADGRLASYNRTTIADAMGNFEFTGIPAGDYWLECNISWEVPGRFGLEKTGGIVRKEITVLEGQSQRIMLTP